MFAARSVLMETLTTRAWTSCSFLTRRRAEVWGDGAMQATVEVVVQAVAKLRQPIFQVVAERRHLEQIPSGLGRVDLARALASLGPLAETEVAAPDPG